MALTVFDISQKMSIKSKSTLLLEDFAISKPTLFGSFRERIRWFLDNFAEIEDYTVDGMPIWCTFLDTKNDGVLALYTVEETVQYSTTHSIPFCNHCKLSGWGHHFVTKRKYHFIISVNGDLNEPLKENFAQIRSHCLYGLIHCNGYGHLICVNGLNNNSNLFTATDAIEFWNNLCTFLKTREISVRDVLRKGLVELRLIHLVAYGELWFEKWGYMFSGGSSGITEQRYNKAIQYLNSLRLSKIVCDFKNKRNGKKIRQMIDRYQELSENPLVTTSDLLQFMLTFESRNVVQITNNKAYSLVGENAEYLMGFEEFVDSMVESDCRWSAKRLEEVLIVIVNLLKDHKCDMPRHELREEARRYVGDTGLIDFVLKCIKCFRVGNHTIRRVTNPSTKVAHFTIDEGFNEAKSVQWPFSCKWSEDKLDNAAKVVTTILTENLKTNTMARQELHERAKVHIHDMGLIDFVLNSLNNSKIGNRTVYQTKNPITKRIEFAVAENYETSLLNIDNSREMNLNQDVLFLYKNVLLGYPEMSSVGLATRIILESKQFVKEWPIEHEVVNQFMTLTCKVLPSFDEMETELNRPLSPGVVVVVPPSITIGELKAVVQCALRETYCVMDEFVVNQIGGLRSVEDDKMLSSVVEPGGCVWVRGWGLDLDTEMRYEDGLETFVHG